MLKKAGSQPFNPENIKDTDLRAYVKHLNVSLNKQNQELKLQSLKNKIYEDYFHSDSTQQLLQLTAEDIRLPGSSLRLLVMESQAFGKRQTFVGECGEFSREYAYLDEQIVKQLENKTQLIIPDTTKIHSIKFAPEKRFPKTIAAFHFLHAPQGEGFLLLTFEVVKEFTDYEIDLLSQVSESLEKVCSWSQRFAEKSSHSGMLERALELVDFPIFVLNDRKEICFGNQFLRNWSKDQLDEVRKNVQIAEWLESGKEDIEASITIFNRNYYLKGIKITEKGEMEVALFSLIDETDFIHKQAYMELVMETICHDFKSSLVNLQGFSKLLGMVGEMNPKQSEYLGLIGSGVEDISNIVNDLFELSRLDQGGGLRLTTNQPVELLNRAIALVQAEARQKRIEIKLSTTSTNGVAIDREFFLAAIHTLLSNAVRNSHIGGIIYLEENVADGKWAVSVRDEGKGISQVDIEKLEATHFQTKEWPGLALVNRIARFHDGKLLIESELGKGSKFIVQLPC